MSCEKAGLTTQGAHAQERASKVRSGQCASCGERGSSGKSLNQEQRQRGGGQTQSSTGGARASWAAAGVVSPPGSGKLPRLRAENEADMWAWSSRSWIFSSCVLHCPLSSLPHLDWFPEKWGACSCITIALLSERLAARHSLITKKGKELFIVWVSAPFNKVLQLRCPLATWGLCWKWG